MHYINLFVFSLLQLGVFAQLNCSTKHISKGDSTRCYFADGKISSVRYPDAKHERYFHFIAYNTSGTVVFEGEQGYLHGSSGLDVTYHTTGAVHTIRRTFQPDGGIQHYDETFYFNEDGSFSHSIDNSWDRELTIHYELETEPVQPAVNQCMPVPQKDSIALYIQNSSTHTVRILIGKIGSSAEKKLIKIRNDKKVLVGYYLPMNNEQAPTRYFDIDVLPDRRSFQGKLFWWNDSFDGKTNTLFVIKPIPHCDF
jgi:hypothetical protein